MIVKKKKQSCASVGQLKKKEKDLLRKGKAKWVKIKLEISEDNPNPIK